MGSDLIGSAANDRKLPKLPELRRGRATRHFARRITVMSNLYIVGVTRLFKKGWKREGKAVATGEAGEIVRW